MKSHENEIQAQYEEINEKSTPSIFRLNIFEILAGLLIGVLMILNFRHTILGLEPWTPLEFYSDWFTSARAELLRDYGWFFFITGFLATVSLIRCVRHQYHLVPHLGQISPKGYLTLIWPILFIIPDFHFTLSLLFCAWWPVILAISVIIFAISWKQQNNQGDLLPVLLNLPAFLPYIFYALRVWDLTSD